ncbi:hypothetical protein GOODEAATRI_033452 [Goodea atripinnis]|uniref:Uncharacterized protein n=1 Tax=Goodea atripinnis TaxID=208336 RepID=A0ABV0PJ60_9TELE
MDRCSSEFSQSHQNPVIGNFLNSNGLLDVWRVSNPDIRQFTWIKPDGNAKSRTDYWFVSASMMQFNVNTNISRSPLRDHCRTSWTISNQTLQKKPGLLEVQLILLNNDKYSWKIKELIQNIHNNNNYLSQIQTWELSL